MKRVIHSFINEQECKKFFHGGSKMPNYLGEPKVIEVEKKSN